MPKKLDPKLLVPAFAIWAALLMLALWLIANMGLYVSAAELMTTAHMFFNLTLVGLIGGMVEAAVMSSVMVYAFILIYNWLRKEVS